MRTPGIPYEHKAFGLDLTPDPPSVEEFMRTRGAVRTKAHVPPEPGIHWGICGTIRELGCISLRAERAGNMPAYRALAVVAKGLRALDDAVLYEEFHRDEDATVAFVELASGWIDDLFRLNESLRKKKTWGAAEDRELEIALTGIQEIVGGIGA